MRSTASRPSASGSRTARFPPTASRTRCCASRLVSRACRATLRRSTNGRCTARSTCGVREPRSAPAPNCRRWPVTPRLPAGSARTRSVRRSERSENRTRDGGHRSPPAMRVRLSGSAALAARVLREQSSERIGLAASGAAFWLVISAFPTTVAVVSIYGLFVSPQRVANDLGGLASGVPGSLGSLISEQLRRVVAADQRRLSVGLVVSLVLALWSASTGVRNLDGAVRAAYRLPAQRFV